MKAILAALALSALVAGPSFAQPKPSPAKPSPIATDKKDAAGDAAAAAADDKAWLAHHTRAAEHRRKAHDAHQAYLRARDEMNKQFSIWHNELHAAHAEEAAARKYKGMAKELHEAASLRALAARRRLTANRELGEATTDDIKAAHYAQHAKHYAEEAAHADSADVKRELLEAAKDDQKHADDAKAAAQHERGEAKRQLELAVTEEKKAGELEALAARQAAAGRPHIKLPPPPGIAQTSPKAPPPLHVPTVPVTFKAK